jgi:hypothetical protein
LDVGESITDFGLKEKSGGGMQGYKDRYKDTRDTSRQGEKHSVSFVPFVSFVVF